MIGEFKDQVKRMVCRHYFGVFAGLLKCIFRLSWKKVTLRCGGSAEHLIRCHDEAAGLALTLQTRGDGS